MIDFAIVKSRDSDIEFSMLASAFESAESDCQPVPHFLSFCMRLCGNSDATSDKVLLHRGPGVEYVFGVGDGDGRETTSQGDGRGEDWVTRIGWR